MQLLPKAAAADLRARIDTFVADTGGKYEHDLPGFKSFRKRVGATETARALYAEIIKVPYNRDLLAAVDEGETAGGRAIADRRGAMWSDMHPPAAVGGNASAPKLPSLPDTAALLFAESAVPPGHIPRTRAWLDGTQFVDRRASMNALVDGTGVRHADAYKTIVARWLATRTDRQQLTNLAQLLANTSALNQFSEYVIIMPPSIPIGRGEVPPASGSADS